jgi:hypothetical protein
VFGDRRGRGGDHDGRQRAAIPLLTANGRRIDLYLPRQSCSTRLYFNRVSYNVMVRAANERTRFFYVGCAAWSILSLLLMASGFGVLAFCGSVLLGIWVFGLRDKFSNEETASAYSVFNQDGQAIVGGLTAGQFDRQLRGGFAQSASYNNDNNDNPVRGSIAIASSEHKSNANDNKLADNERLRRRTAAAAAAERRFQTKE